MEIRDYGIIIRTSDFRENDKTLEIYTKKNGLLKAYAFGAKRSKKRFGGNLIPYNILYLYLKKHRDYLTLEEVNVIKYFPNLSKNLLNLKILFNVSALLSSQKGHSDEGIFKLIYFLLFYLDKSREDEERLKFYLLFCVYMLKKEGIIDKNYHCHSCGSRTLSHIVSDDNSIYFKCPSCINEKEVFSEVDKEFLDFFIQSLNPQKSFLSINFNKNLLKKIENTILPILIKYFNVSLELLNMC